MQAVPPPRARAPGPAATCPPRSASALGLGALILLSLYVWKPAFVGVVVVAVVLAVCELSNAFGARPASGCRSSPSRSVRSRCVVSAYAGGSRGAGRRPRADRCSRSCSGGCRRTRRATSRDVTAGVVRRRLRAVPRRLRGAAARPRRRRRPGRRLHRARRSLSDIGGYVAGVLFGKHPMAPTVSPKKSWEGFAGSVAVLRRSAVRSRCRCCSTARWWEGVLIGLAVDGARPPSATSASR